MNYKFKTMFLIISCIKLINSDEVVLNLKMRHLKTGMLLDKQLCNIFCAII